MIHFKHKSNKKVKQKSIETQLIKIIVFKISFVMYAFQKNIGTATTEF